MDNNLEFKDFLNEVNGALENGKANCSVGLFVSDYCEETVKDVSNMVVKKPVVEISSFVQDNELFYTISFHFKSYNDADYKQMWRYLCDFARKARREGEMIERGEVLDKVSVLTVNVVPDKYNGKYFAYINMPLYETLQSEENAYDETAVISFICEESNFSVLYADDDVIDRRSVEAEAERELDLELGV